jgi:proteic killer suppression protein
VIRHFKSDETADLFRDGKSRRWASVARVALRKLDQLHEVTELSQLAVPPGNRLEALAGNRIGQHSIRINDQWRLCFRWHERNAYDVEIVDYH